MFFADGKTNRDLSPIGIRPIGFNDFATVFDLHVGSTCFVAGSPDCDEIRTRFNRPRFCRDDVGDRSRELFCFQIENLKRNLCRNCLAGRIRGFEDCFVGSGGQLKFR